MLKLKYFNFKNDFDDLKNSSSNANKALAGGKIFAKGVANLGVFALTELPVAVAEQVLKNDKATFEQKEKARQIIDKFSQDK